MGKKRYWIKDAIKHPGALRKSLHAKKGENIPEDKLDTAAKKKGTLGRRARLAKLLKRFSTNRSKRAKG